MSPSPDVILMDILMGGMTGIEATPWIKEQDRSVKVILISSEVKKELFTKRGEGACDQNILVAIEVQLLS